MGMRRVVTGHTPDGASVIVRDEVIEFMPVGVRGGGVGFLWGRDDPASYPDDGSQPAMSDVFPPVGGSALSVLELPIGGDEFHEFVRENLAKWSDPDEAGMHRTPTIDYDVVLNGVVGLELDDGVEVALGAGDVVVQNGTRHRWHNRGDTVARVLAVTIGAHHSVAGGQPV